MLHDRLRLPWQLTTNTRQLEILVTTLLALQARAIFSVLKKIHFISNCTRNHLNAYTNRSTFRKANFYNILTTYLYS